MPYFTPRLVEQVTLRNNQLINWYVGGLDVIPVTLVSGFTSEMRLGTNSPRVNGKLRLRQNDFHYNRTKVFAPPLEVVYREQHIWHQMANVEVPFTTRGEALNNCSAKFYKQLGQISFNAPINLYQSQQAVDMFAINFKRLALGLKAVVSRDPFLLAKALRLGQPKVGFGKIKKPKPRPSEWNKALADSFLEYQFGWAPLLSDLQGGLELIAISNAQGQQRTETCKTRSTAKLSAAGTGITVSEEFKTDWEVQESATACIHATFLRKPQNLVSQLGISNPALALWDAVPFSFLVDFAVGVGEWLQTRPEFIQGIEIISVSSTSTVHQSVTHMHATNNIPWRGYPDYVTESRGFSVIIDKIRDVNMPSPPTLRLKNPLSVTHVLDVVALISQFRR